MYLRLSLDDDCKGRIHQLVEEEFQKTTKIQIQKREFQDWYLAMILLRAINRFLIKRLVVLFMELEWQVPTNLLERDADNSKAQT